MILENLSSIIAGLIILSILGAAVFAQVRKKKSGAGCGMACSACRGCPGAQRTREHKHLALRVYCACGDEMAGSSEFVPKL